MVRCSLKSLSHDLVLAYACYFSSIHGVSITSRCIFDEGQAERTATILISGKLGYELSVLSRVSISIERTNSSLCVFGGIKLDHASTTRAAVCLILDFSTLDFPNSCEKLDKILVAC